MEKTNANDFRANLKEWMDAAKDEPIKIIRKTGESFVLLNADAFEKTQIELATLRGISKGLADALQGRTHKATTQSTQSAIAKAKELVRGKKSKKVAG